MRDSGRPNQHKCEGERGKKVRKDKYKEIGVTEFETVRCERCERCDRESRRDGDQVIFHQCVDSGEEEGEC